MEKKKNEIATTLRMSEEKYAEFKEYAHDTNISLNSALKTAASIGLKVLKGSFQNVALVGTPLADCSIEQTSSERTQ